MIGSLASEQQQITFCVACLGYQHQNIAEVLSRLQIQPTIHEEGIERMRAVNTLLPQLVFQGEFQGRQEILAFDIKCIRIEEMIGHIMREMTDESFDRVRGSPLWSGYACSS